MPYRTLWIAAACTLAMVTAGIAQQPPAAPQQAPPEPVAPSQSPETESPETDSAETDSAETDAERNERFADYMTGAKFAGRFTVVGDEADAGKMPTEEYLIRKCEKLPQADLFRFTARIRYGETDMEVPMDLPVKWAGRTPVITLENLWIPGLGTFSARVVIHHDRYAGTWDHGAKGGHLFGRIEHEEAR